MSMPRRVACLTALATAMLLVQGCAATQQQTWERQIRAAQQAREAERFDVSEAHLQQALATAEASEDPLALAPPTLDRLCSLYISMGRDAPAEKACLRSLAMREERLGPDHLEITRSLTLLVELRLWQGRYAEAHEDYLRVLEIREATLGPDHPLVATSLCFVARSETLRRNYDAAEALFHRCIAIREAALGPGHPDVARALLGYAELLQAAGREQEATALRFRGRPLEAADPAP